MHTHVQAGPPAVFKEPVHANASWNETIELAKKKGLQKHIRMLPPTCFQLPILVDSYEEETFEF